MKPSPSLVHLADDFLRNIFKEQQVLLCRIADGAPPSNPLLWKPDTSLEELQVWMSDANDKGEHCYFHGCGMADGFMPAWESSGRSAKLQKRLCGGSRLIWADVDVPVKKLKNSCIGTAKQHCSKCEYCDWYFSAHAAVGNFAANFPSITHEMYSGTGFWLISALNKPLPPAEVEELRVRLGRALKEYFKFESVDVKVDQCVKNIDRLCRLPGSINHKSGNIAYVQRFYDFENFTEYEDFVLDFPEIKAKLPPQNLAPVRESMKGAEWVQSLAQEVARTAEGSRNNTLFDKATFAWKAAVFLDDCTEREWRTAFEAAGKQCGLEEEEVTRTLDSAKRTKVEEGYWAGRKTRW